MLNLMAVTQTVGSHVLSSFNKINHEVPMLSLDNVFSAEDILDFIERINNRLKRSLTLSFCVEPKLDGLAISLLYEKGHLVRAATRGDGAVFP